MPPIFLILLIIKETLGKCPCAPLYSKEAPSTPMKMCGWQINNGIGNENCKENEIYEGCTSKNDTSEEARVFKSCVNQCFPSEDRRGVACGVCGEWGVGGRCVRIEKVTDEKETLSNPRPKEKQEMSPRAQSMPNERSVLIGRSGDPLSPTPTCPPSALSPYHLELVFILDASITYFTENNDKKDFIQLFRKNIDDIINHTNRIFPSSTYGLSAFSDWEQRTGSFLDYCYECICPLAPHNEDSSMKSCVTEVTGAFGNDAMQSSATAIYYTLNDKSMGWSEGEFYKGKKIIRALVLFTSGPWITYDWVKKEGKTDPIFNFPKPTGDGDDCSKNAPSVDQLKTVIREKEALFIGFIDERVEGKWEKYVKEMGNLEGSYIQVVSADERIDVDVPRIALYLERALVTLGCGRFFPGGFNIQGL